DWAQRTGRTWRRSRRRRCSARPGGADPAAAGTCTSWSQVSASGRGYEFAPAGKVRVNVDTATWSGRNGLELVVDEGAAAGAVARDRHDPGGGGRRVQGRRPLPRRAVDHAHEERAGRRHEIAERLDESGHPGGDERGAAARGDERDRGGEAES